jgi:hypothetical protein
MMDPHLSDDVIEALAHDRLDLAPSEAADHVAGCAECRALVEEAQALSFSLRDALWSSRENTALDLELDAIVSAAVTAGLSPDRREALASLRPVKAPARTPLALAIAAGLAVAALPALVSRPELPSVGLAVDLLRALRLVLSAVDVAVSAVPGGWGLVMFTGLVSLALLALPAYRLAGARRRVPGSLVMSLASVALCFALVPPAHALEFEGELPEQAQLTIDLNQVPTSEALRRIAQAAQLGLVVTLPDDPKVTVRVRKAPLKEVLTAVLGDAPVLVKREGSLLIVRPLPAAAPAEPTPPAPPAPPSEAPIVQPLVPLPPTPPLPPSLGRRGRGRNDRVTFGGNSVIRAGERVKDVVTLGGNTTIYGIVEGDVVVIGGNTTIKKGAEVFGEIVALGGNVDTEEGAVLHQGQSDDDGADEPAEDEDEDAQAEAEDSDESDAGEPDDQGEDEDDTVVAGVRAQGSGHGGGAGHPPDHDEASEESSGWFSDTLSSFSRHALLFVLGLVLLGAFPSRLSGVTSAIQAAPLRAGALGVLGVLGAAVLSVLLTITLIGIPAAIVLLLGSALALYAGLAATALVVGGMLPFGSVRGQPIRELAVGVLLLFLLSRIPVLGAIAMGVACAVGFGAIVSTRFAAPPLPPAPPAEGTPPAATPGLPDPATPEIV